MSLLVIKEVPFIAILANSTGLPLENTCPFIPAAESELVKAKRNNRIGINRIHVFLVKFFFLRLITYTVKRVI
jgi:hypothetical protein